MKNFWTVTGLAFVFCASMVISSPAQQPTPNPSPSKADRDGKVLVDKNGKEVGKPEKPAKPAKPDKGNK